MNLRLARLRPRSLFSRIALILFAGLAAAHLLTVGLLLYDRAQATNAMMIAYFVKDVASSVAILDRVPAAERPEWLPRLQRGNYRYALGPSNGAPETSLFARTIVEALTRELHGKYAITASIADRPRSPSDLALNLRLQDGAPLTIEVTPPGSGMSPWVSVALFVQLAILALFTWLAVRTATRPLERLANAADRLGLDLRSDPIPEEGPEEVARAASALNAMQRRIAGHLAERVRILAAISHDLQTPITRMRLRVDLLDDKALRTKLQSDLIAMQALVREGLEFARSEATAVEPAVATDIQALCESLVYDYEDAGHAVELSGELSAPIVTRPQTLRRLMSNLIDNALKFGSKVEVAIESPEKTNVTIAVRDRGPGIPADEIEAVLKPFYRVDQSRNRETGGTGLGLAIAARLAGILGGALELSNRPDGGLEASVTLPAAAAEPLGYSDIGSMVGSGTASNTPNS